jgi:O-antigen/teichoic acid export membrane protein
MNLPRLRHNIAALGAMEIAIYLIPLVTLPYLTRTLGVESYGKVAFVQVVIAFSMLLVDYGFSWSATQKISAHRGERALIAKIFSATWAAQWLLAMLACVFISAALLTIPLLSRDANLYVMGMLIVFGNVLFPLWLLQGLERMREVAIIQVISRIAVLPLVFIFVRDSTDTIIAVALVGMGSVIAGIMSLVWIKRFKIVEFQRPVIHEIAGALRAGAGLFVSRISISTYTVLIPLILGVVAGPAVLAYFNLADKARSAAQSALSPIAQALFPRMSHLYKYDQIGARNLLNKSMLAVLLVGGGSGALLWVFSDYIVLILGGPSFSDAAAVLRWLSMLPLIIGLSNIFGVQVMLPNGLNRIFNSILIAASIISLIVVWPLVRHNGASGAAQTILVIEIFVTCCMGGYLWHHGYFKKGLGVKNEI